MRGRPIADAAVGHDPPRVAILDGPVIRRACDPVVAALASRAPVAIAIWGVA